ncbi:hypothetical protein LAN32_21955, partial [Mycobacterium tuberculosis]|nr:hypothetical protein [Mycobacterium tuberculosis]
DQRRSLTAEKCGHYGIFSGRRWRTIIYPQLRDFIREHAPEPKHGATKDATEARAAKTLSAVPAGDAPAETTRATAAKRTRAKAPAKAAAPAPVKAAPAAKRAAAGSPRAKA